MPRFWSQPSGSYKAFQIVYTVLTVQFVVAACTYTFAPLTAHEQFNALNLLVGGYPYYFPEDQSIFYRVLGAANVFALGFMCAFLQWNLRRHFVVLVPLVFLKASAATIWLIAFVSRPLLRASLAASLFDYLTCVVMVVAAVPAYRSIRGMDDGELVPRPKATPFD